MKPLKLRTAGDDTRLKKRKIGRLFKRLFPVFLLIGVFFVIAFLKSLSSGTNIVVNYVFNTNNLKSTGGRVNVLFLGIAGGKHDGANLTDTIMVASYDLKGNEAHLISIPRDLWLPSLKSKANAAYQLGLNQDNGLAMAKTVMGNIVGLPIHYAFRIDFRGFVQAVDAVGGIDVSVDNSFDDYNYPVEGKENDLCGYEEKEMDFSDEDAKKLNIEKGKRKVFIAPDGSIATDSATEDKGAKYFTCRYEHISFKEGTMHLNGETALKFVRSRHGTNGEASDFARSARQEKVLQALRGKILSVETLTSASRISDLLKTLGQSVDTDISPKEAVEFYRLVKQMTKTHTLVLDDSPKKGLEENRKSLLVHPPASNYGGAYVLVSQDDDFSTVQGYIRKVLLKEITLDEASTSARISY